METRNDSLFWIWLSLKLGAANKNALRLLEYFGSPYEIMRADEEAFSHLEWLDEATAAKLRDNNLDEAYEIIDYCSTKGYGIIFYDSANYPKSLRNLSDPPIVLYYKGELPDFDNKLCISMVGTRKMSEYGMRSAYKIAYELASAGVVIVSGMALGLDSVSQCGALAAGGKTVAVIGCGLDTVYPTEHEILENAICDHGAIITEYPPQARPEGFHFPQRNRIISGLSQGTLVIEADMKSGALITARDAIIQGRDVFAIPGSTEEANSEGTNMLIHDGASMVLASDDIFENYKYLYSAVLSGESYTRSKSRSDFNPAILKELGVSARYYNGGYGSKYRPLGKNPPASVAVRGMPDMEAEKLREQVIKSEEKRRKVKAAPKPEPPEKTYTAPANTEASGKKDMSALVASLSDDYRAVLTAMPVGKSVTSDSIVSGKMPVGKVMAALTMLEIMGLVSSLPGGMYMRNQ